MDIERQAVGRKKNEDGVRICLPAMKMFRNFYLKLPDTREVNGKTMKQPWLLIVLCVLGPGAADAGSGGADGVTGRLLRFLKNPNIPIVPC